MVRLHLALGAFLVFAPLAHAGDRLTHGAMAQVALDDIVLPNVRQLKVQTNKLRRAVADLCEDLTKVRARSGPYARARFKDVVKTWAAVELVRLGPTKADNRLDRFFFWPDPRGTARRQIARALAKENPKLTDPDVLKTHSAALQGLTALEQILFSNKVQLGTSANGKGAYRCGLANAITANMDSIATEIAAGWEGDNGYRMTMLQSGSDNPLYRDAEEAAREFLKAIVVGIDFAVARHALPITLAAARTPPGRARVPFAFSGLTATYLKAEVIAIEALFNAIGLAAYVPPDKQWMVTRVGRTFADVRAISDIFEETKDRPTDDPDRLRAARRLMFELNALRSIIAKQIAPAAGLSLGFNELDGD